MFEIVVEESSAGPHQTYDERTRAIFEDGEVQFIYEYLEDGTWVAWDDVGCHLPEHVLLLIAGILENKEKIMDASGQG